jgi:hypothetical protein
MRGWDIVTETQGRYCIRFVLLRPSRRHKLAWQEEPES